jgi:Lrp/AsnC family transcriptional regulator
MSSEPKPTGLDAIDRRILMLLQENADTPIAEIASRVSLSQTPCWNRIKKLERDGVIRGRVAVLDPARIGLGLTVLVFVEASEHRPQALEGFAQALAAMPEVIEAHRLAGRFDFMLQVVVADTAAYDRFYARLIGVAPIKSVTSHMVMGELKPRSPLPMPD